MLKIYSLTNEKNLTIRISNLGGIIQSIIMPDKNGTLEDIVLGYSDIESYLKDSNSFGCIVGRYANRIANGRFMINSKEFILPQNEGRNCLHGGIEGFGKKIWDTKEISGKGFTGLEMYYLSRDNEEGFPGNLQVWVIYKLTEKNELIIEYKARTDKSTVINLTNHSYFNLGGHKSGNVLGHTLSVNGPEYIELDEFQIPTGRILSVEGTPLDFTKSEIIGKRINVKFDQLIFGMGYDQSYVIKKTEELPLAAVLCDSKSGRKLSVYTTEPAVQVYSSNHLKMTKGKDGYVYEKYAGFCFETQHYADSPNHKNFPSTLLNQGEEFCSKTVFKFEA